MHREGGKKREIQRSKRGREGRRTDIETRRERVEEPGRTAFTAFHWTAVSNGHNAGPAFFT